MKIVYCALKFDYGKPERGYSFEHYNFYGSLEAMDQRQHEITYFPFDEKLREKGREEMNHELLRVVKELKPDLCFFFLFTDEIFPETIKKISEMCPTVNWFADDHWRFYNFSRHYAPAFHWIATTDSKAPERYRKCGYKNIIKTQWACNPALYHPVSGDYRAEVSFVGQKHSDRGKIVNKLLCKKIPIACFGKGWSSGRISTEDMVATFSQSKINLNFTSSSLALTDVAKIFIKKKEGVITMQSPKTWPENLLSLGGKLRRQIKGRTFEIPACGGFELTQAADDLETYYIPGKEIACFDTLGDLIEKITYYTAHDAERKKIAEAGYLRTIQEHTYEKRFQEIFKLMGVYASANV